ncbi:MULTISPECIES: chymotrypsin family serine protease [Mycobacteriaceae]|uniref:hypothetical protein n=1 Tax=Mycobacteriaceae TaxID=1762 RepID=UPI0007EF1807|nr:MULTISPECIES: hypothetical protein [Mycobacteriaceae]MDO2981391.1 hypothetical protein [Mycobacteroides abscessus subsp. abscessus]OBK68045.1 hypothetical protein A5654_15340 [Mycolicibacterium fortuitum]SIH16171.1 trypsin domain-containing protein [Mycobacteroides abscessus subsp. abscessus]
MSRNRYALIAIAAAAAMAVSACTGTAPAEPKPWPNVGTGGAVAAPTSATVKSPVWVTAPWTGKVNKNEKDDQYGSVPVPGIVIAQQRGSASPGRCTIGPAVYSADHGPGFVTAGHCDKLPGSPLLLYPTPSTSFDSAQQIPGRYLETEARDTADMGSGLVSDSTMVPVSAIDPTATKIADRYAVAGVLTATAVEQLLPGTPVCFDGSSSGVVCGDLLNSNEDGRIRFDVSSLEGDSGAPVFLLDQRHRAVLIGIHKGGNGITASATYLDPALMRLGASVLLAPSVEPMDGPGLSPRIRLS